MAMSTMTPPPNGSDMKAHSATECGRCQGPTVPEVFVDWTSGGGHLSFPGRRCILCGDITDSLILSHRADRPRRSAHSVRHARGRAFTAVPVVAKGSHPTGNTPQ